jgi:hypothetical protein
MLAYEQLGAHGYPVLCDAAHPFSKLLPRLFTFRHILKSESALNDNSLRKLAGNGMHLAAVGLALTWAVMGIWPDDEALEKNAKHETVILGDLQNPSFVKKRPARAAASSSSAPAVMKKPAMMKKPAAGPALTTKKKPARA